MAEEPEQLGLSNRDQAAQDKALDQLTDRVCAVAVADANTARSYFDSFADVAQCRSGRGKGARCKQSAHSHGRSISFTKSRPRSSKAQVCKSAILVVCSLRSSVADSVNFFLCRDKKLAAIKVNKEDVDIIAAEFELDTKTADRRLREHSGNLVEALQSFL